MKKKMSCEKDKVFEVAQIPIHIYFFTRQAKTTT